MRAKWAFQHPLNTVFLVNVLALGSPLKLGDALRSVVVI